MYCDKQSSRRCIQSIYIMYILHCNILFSQILILFRFSAFFALERHMGRPLRGNWLRAHFGRNERSRPSWKYECHTQLQWTCGPGRWGGWCWCGGLRISQFGGRCGTFDCIRIVDSKWVVDKEANKQKIKIVRRKLHWTLTN